MLDRGDRHGLADVILCSMKSKLYRPWTPDQSHLFPASPRDWLPEDHLAFFLLDVVATLDLEAIESVIQAGDPRGVRPYHPRLMLTLWIYAYSVGVHSSRGVAQAIVERVDFRAIAGENRPHWTVLNEFRRVHRGAFRDLFVQVVRLCAGMGLVELGHVAIDGTKVKADASKHKAMSYERMKEVEARLQEEIEELLARSEQLDAAEDQLYGSGSGSPSIPEELRFRRERLERIRAAQAGLEEEARQARAAVLRGRAEAKRASAAAEENERVRKQLQTKAKRDEERADALDGGQDDEPPPPTQLPEGRPPHVASAEPHPKAQRNFTDSDSRIMKGPDGGFIQAYNGQAAVDHAHQIVVAADVTNQAADSHSFSPMLHQVIENLDGVPGVTSADCGYWSSESATTAEELGTEPLIPLERTSRWRPRTGQQANAPPPEGTTPRERMAHRMSTEVARREYKKRNQTVEPVFGHLKEIRSFRQFSFRGLQAVAAEWALVCTVHNLIKMWRETSRTPTAA